MRYFDFSLFVIDQIVSELKRAEFYIRIAIFQLHNQEIINVLNDKLKSGIRVEIFTLPYDSIDEKIRARVTKQFDELSKNGAILHICAWNIGNPGRTSTAIGRWYSFHGKFIVTDKSAISLSANFTDNKELDAILIYKDEKDKINQFNQVFDRLYELFCKPYNNFDGNIRSLIQKSSYSKSDALFKTPEVIGTDKHESHWITDYPAELCPDKILYPSTLLICPFDVRARSIINQIIGEAQEYLLISTESFTDNEIINELIKASLNNVNIKILSSDKSMDFTDRIGNNFRYLIASGIEIRTTKEDLHAKLIISEKKLAISSINLNKINLGFKTLSNLWRSNTETLTLEDDEKLVLASKEKYLSIFNNSFDIELSLASKVENDIKVLFSKILGVRSNTKVNNLFSKFLLTEEINVKQKMLHIGKLCKYVMNYYKNSRVSLDVFIISLILYYLSDNKLKYDSIEDRLSTLDVEIDLHNILENMIQHNLIIKEDEFYKLRVISIFEGLTNEM